eukprot:Partr_v1_DN27640_c2_g1_i4_m65491 putative syntaxin binding protein
MIRSVSGMGSWKVLIVDYFGLKILNSCMKMDELVDENITFVEPLESQRMPRKQLEAIYFIRPTSAAITRIIEDFTPHPVHGDCELYEKAHIFFISDISDVDQYRLAHCAAVPFIASTRSLHLDFLPLESQAFSLDSEYALSLFYGRECPHELYELEQEKMARQIAQFCINLGEFPFIRFCKNGKFDNLTGKTAALVYRELHHHAKTDPEFPIREDDFLGPNRAELIIVDRASDPNAPLVHEFTYQAMAADLLDMNDASPKYEHTFVNEKGEPETEKVVLEETTDKLWASIRHSHIADCVDDILLAFKQFLATNAESSSYVDVISIDSLKEVLAGMPEFQDLKKKLAVHISLSQDCLDAFKSANMHEIASIEQDLVTGLTRDGHRVKDVEDRISDVVADRNVDLYDKLRLLMLYVLNHGVVNEEGRDMFIKAKLGGDVKEVIRNLTGLGIDLITPGPSSRKPTKLQKRENARVSFELSRFKTVAKRVMDDAVDGVLSEKYFPYIKDPNEPHSYGSWNLSADDDIASIRTFVNLARPSWHLHRRTSDDTVGSFETRKRGKVIYFVIGGMTFSEMRSAYEATNEGDKLVIIGSTHIITAQSLVQDLRMLREPVEVPPPPDIPRDTPRTAVEVAAGSPGSMLKQMFKGLGLDRLPSLDRLGLDKH